jgi:hypothetical protein
LLSQNGVVAGQLDPPSAEGVHAMMQRPWSQGWPPQSAVVRHCAHCPSGEHFGVAPEHCASVAHPARQRSSWGSQTGCAVPQSEFARHCTQRPSRTSQRGAVAPQSAFAAHWTHDCVEVLQMGAVAGQSAFALQPTQAPVDVLQIGAAPVHDGLPVQAA